MQPTDPGWLWKLSRMARRLPSRLPWSSITPLGRAVEPEVYCRKAIEARTALDGRADAVLTGQILADDPVDFASGGRARLGAQLVQNGG